MQWLIMLTIVSCLASCRGMPGGECGAAVDDTPTACPPEANGWSEEAAQEAERAFDRRGAGPL
jgi:hypothetical protein